MLPELVEPGAFPAAAGFGVGFWLANEVGQMRSNKGSDRLTMALETEAQGQFISRQLKVGRLLQRYELFEELGSLRWPIWPVVPTGELGTQLGAVSQPETAQSVEVGTADLEVVRSFRAVDLPCVKLLENVLEKGVG